MRRLAKSVHRTHWRRRARTNPEFRIPPTRIPHHPFWIDTQPGIRTDRPPCRPALTGGASGAAKIQSTLRSALGRAGRQAPTHDAANRQGSVAEWSIATVLKTGDSQESVSSNLTASANPSRVPDRLDTPVEARGGDPTSGARPHDHRIAPAPRPRRLDDPHERPPCVDVRRGQDGRLDRQRPPRRTTCSIRRSRPARR